MYGTARPINLVQQLAETLARELDVNRTVDLIDEWEASVGLPDTCIAELTDLQTRRDSVIDRIRKIPLVTIEQLQAYVDQVFPDKDVQLVLGSVTFSFEYSFEYDFVENSERFVIVAEVPSQEPTFELDFEYNFTSGVDETEIRCVIERVIPANVALFIREVI